MVVKFEYQGEVIAKERVRMSKWGVYTPKKTKAFETAIKKQYIEQGLHKFENRYIRAEIDVFVKVPKSYSKKKYIECIGRKFYPSKKDLDNYIKSILDGLHDAAFDNDNLVVTIIARKIFDNKDGFVITLEDLGEVKK